MSCSVRLRARGSRALDLLNFFIADVQTGFGPFISVYLTTQKWTQAEIGFALSLSTVVSLIAQVPAGALVDAMRSKRLATAGGLVGVCASALLLALWPHRLPVFLAQLLHGAASCLLTPAIAAMSLSLVGHAALGERIGRNARFASIGNAVAAAVMGASGTYLSSAAVFWLTAVLCVPALATLLAIGGGPAPAPPGRVRPKLDRIGLRKLFTDRRLLVFLACVVLFHLSNAAMLPVAAAEITRRVSDFANLLIAACVFAQQAGVALLSPWVGRTAAIGGRRSMMLLGWAALPVRGVMMAVVPGPAMLVTAQLVSGVSAAAFGVILSLTAADLTRETGHFTLCLGVLGVAVSIGATLSTALAGWAASAFGPTIAIGGLAAAGLAGTLLVLWAMPETAPARE